VGAPVELFSKSAGGWVPGEVSEVNTETKMARLRYKNKSGAMMEKWLLFSSGDLRPRQGLDRL
jgi:hypothetical protein